MLQRDEITKLPDDGEFLYSSTKEATGVINGEIINKAVLLNETSSLPNTRTIIPDMTIPEIKQDNEQIVIDTQRLNKAFDINIAEKIQENIETGKPIPEEITAVLVTQKIVKMVNNPVIEPEVVSPSNKAVPETKVKQAVTVTDVAVKNLPSGKNPFTGIFSGVLADRLTDFIYKLIYGNN